MNIAIMTSMSVNPARRISDPASRRRLPA
jgi:hypothetical protein